MSEKVRADADASARQSRLGLQKSVGVFAGCLHFLIIYASTLFGYFGFLPQPKHISVAQLDSEVALTCVCGVFGDVTADTFHSIQYAIGRYE